MCLIKVLGSKEILRSLKKAMRCAHEDCGFGGFFSTGTMIPQIFPYESLWFYSELSSYSQVKHICKIPDVLLQPARFLQKKDLEKPYHQRDALESPSQEATFMQGQSYNPGVDHFWSKKNTVISWDFDCFGCGSPTTWFESMVLFRMNHLGFVFLVISLRILPWDSSPFCTTTIWETM